MKIWHPCVKPLLQSIEQGVSWYKSCGKEGWQKTNGGYWLCEEHFKDKALIKEFEKRGELYS